MKPQPRKPDLNKRKPENSTSHQCEADVVEGLEFITHEELHRRFGSQVRVLATGAGRIRFVYNGDLRTLLHLQTVTSVYLVHLFSVPRPRALLGHEHFHTLLHKIAVVRGLHPHPAYRTLHVDAAGSDSSIMTRLKDELAAHTGLAVDAENGDLQLRFRRPPDGNAGWEALIRLTPRPLATRLWRICNFEGALNAAAAHAMALLTQPTANDIFLNLACGSGTILIERLGCRAAKRIIGVDISPTALICSRTNLDASSNLRRVTLIQGDAQRLPFPDRSIDKLAADLPFGQLVGSHEGNKTLYPHLLEEAARVARTDALFVALTHEIRLMDSVLSQSKHWVKENMLQITLRGLHPRIFVLRRT